MLRQILQAKRTPKIRTVPKRRVLAAVDGKSTLVKWQSEGPNMLIFDTSLPTVNGLEVCRLIREKSQIPVIFLSERSADQGVVAALTKGADDYVNSLPAVLLTCGLNKL